MAAETATAVGNSTSREIVLPSDEEAEVEDAIDLIAGDLVRAG
jgi:hypothetical protein